MQHAGKRSGSPLLACGIIAVVVALLLVAVAGVWYFGGGQSATTEPVTDVTVTTEPPVTTEEPPTTEPPVTTEEEPFVIEKGDYHLPEAMTGAWILPGVDWLTCDTVEHERAAIRKMLDGLVDWKFNTLLLVLQAADGTPVWNVIDGWDPLPFLQGEARARGLYVMAVWDLGVYNGLVDPSVPAEREEAERRFAMAVEHGFETVLLDNVGYAYRDDGDADAYALYGNGQSAVDYQRRCVKKYYTDCVKITKEYNKDIAVGLLAAAVWAHSDNDPRGSRTYSAYEEYTDGRADTLSWVQKGLADLVMVKNYNSTAHTSATFSTTLSWWGDVCAKAEMPLYVSHDADKVDSGLAGWTSPDQLARQALVCMRQSACSGSAFYSLGELKKDYQGSTAALRRVLAGDALSEYIGKELKLTSPGSTTLTTREETVGFLGSADPNFPVLLDGKEIELSQLGQFSLDRSLNPGKNVFTFTHKGKSVTYTVNYDMQVLLSVAPTADIVLDGETVITLSAIARKDSTVKVTVNGKTLAMTPSPIQSEEETAAIPTGFENYAVAYTLPAGIIGKEQPLGKVSVTAACRGVSKTIGGGSITVAALPEPPPQTEPETGEAPHVVGDLTLINPANGSGAELKKGQILAVAIDYAETFTGSTVDDFSRPTNAYLPKGTTDVVVSTVYDAASGNSYYLLGSGLRVYKSSVTAYLTEGTLRENAVSAATAAVSKQYTTLSFHCDWRVPYQLQLLPQTYRAATFTAAQPNYDISKTGITAEYIDLTFCYTGAVPDAPQAGGSPLFSKIEWVAKDAEKHTATLRLTLTEAGRFCGYSVAWDNEGNLIFSFRHPADVSGNEDGKPLFGLTIVIDPGHGGNSSGTYGTIQGLYEKTLALTYSKLVQERLEALGAKVVMSRTGDTNPAMNARTDLARNNGTDLLVSIHMNGVSSTAASGCSIHYFNEYSYAAARSVTDAMREVEKRYETGNRSSPCAWSPFYLCRVHDCPAILVECGFMTNAHNMTLLVDPVYQEELSQAIVDGIVSYFKTRFQP